MTKITDDNRRCLWVNPRSQSAAMKTILLLLIASAFSIVQAEIVDVFLCEGRRVDVEWGESGDEDTTTTLTLYRIGKKAGTLTTGDMAALVKSAKAYDQSHDPFYGPGFRYILKDSRGAHFIAYFEYAEGHATFTGFRVALNEIKPIGTIPGVFEGSAFKGTSFDKDLLSQLKTITQKTAVPKKAADEKR